MSDDHFLYELAGYVGHDPCFCAAMPAAETCITCRARALLKALQDRIEAAKRRVAEAFPTPGGGGHG